MASSDMAWFKMRREEFERDGASPSSMHVIGEMIDDLCARPTDDEARELLQFVRDVRDNDDCDEDAHRYGTTCRCCEAGRVLADWRKERGDTPPEMTADEDRDEDGNPIDRDGGVYGGGNKW